jgi:hypothetical protein
MATVHARLTDVLASDSRVPVFGGVSSSLSSINNSNFIMNRLMFPQTHEKIPTDAYPFTTPSPKPSPMSGHVF